MACFYSEFVKKWKVRGKVLEVAFENEFVSHYPWKACPPCGHMETPIPVVQLCHATHRRKAKQIMSSESKYNFKLFPRVGRFGDYYPDGSPVGHSYTCQLKGAVPTQETVYKYVSKYEFLLPKGKYSWWGIDYPFPNISRYGAHMFKAGFPYMLQQFSHAHATDENTEPGLIFKKYGTLRYKHEICYIALICAESDDLTHVEHLPPVTEEGGYVTLNGMLNADGKVIDHKITSSFNKQQYLDDSWEQLVFGFYFSPDCRTDLVLESAQVQHTHVYHDVNSCTGKFKVKDEHRPSTLDPNKRFICPDHPGLPQDVDMRDLVDWSGWRRLCQ